MRLTVRAHAGAKLQRLVRAGTLAVEAWVRAPARDGRANSELEKLIADGLGVSRSAVHVVRGQSARQKQIEVDGLDAASLAEAVSRLDVRR